MATSKIFIGSTIHRDLPAIGKRLRSQYGSASKGIHRALQAFLSDPKGFLETTRGFPKPRRGERESVMYGVWVESDLALQALDKAKELGLNTNELLSRLLVWADQQPTTV